MATLIRLTGQVETVLPADGKAFSLEELQNYVCGYVELVRCLSPKDNEAEFLLVNEDGRPLRLPENAKASEMTGCVIVGNVLHLTKEEWKHSMDN